MVSIQHLNEAAPAALFHLYPGQQEPQDVFVALSIADKTMWMASNGEIGNGVPMDVWHGTTLRWYMPPIQAAAANALMDKLLPLAERVVAGGTEEWDGSNNVGVYTEDASEAVHEIERIVNDWACERDGFDWMPAAVWFQWDNDEVVGLIRDGLSAQDICARVEADLPTEPMMMLPDLDEYVDVLVEAHRAEENEERKV